ncbi:Uu.00g049130.m01.CDS01 [Anthostomella pinea]|uniref:Uu.00g049130.m01.CDS01 n=1 Tax=Anthostomella pinea TaxID=933095 RepID=A0AAI8VCU5_9PEZI|nr:Uu.00g049130.m01.CDS01 [Anthostomella pinea]
MPSLSSPINYPASSSPPAAAKRPKPHPEPRARPRPRPIAGFLIDDDSDDENAPSAPAAKRRMLSSPNDQVAADHTEPSSPPPELADGASKAVGSTPLETVTLPQGDATRNSNPVLNALFTSSNPDSVFQRFTPRQPPSEFKITTCSGKTVNIKKRTENKDVSFERMVASRSKKKKGRADRSYYGIDIHELVETATKELANQPTRSTPVPDEPMPSVEPCTAKKPKKSLLWTEKYRARNFMDLVGDDLTNRQVLRWLKKWDPLVFPGAAKSRSSIRRPAAQPTEEEKPHRKILMLTGPPGLGKTTLAHVCARQAGYEVMEINASDDRSRDVVKNRIRTSLGTENVKTVQQSKPEAGKQQKVVRPVCLVVDEVDGVVTGSGGSGEGGFIKALMDLITVGEKNASGQATTTQNSGRKKKKGDDFRQMRPLILICNDVYHPSLRPLRQSSLAEIIHVGKPTVDAVVTRLKSVFEKEGIPCEKDAARKLCEAAWGISSGIEAKRGAESTAEGDLRGVMVVGEWVAGRLKSAPLKGPISLTRQWVEHNVLRELSHGGGGARGVGRGNVKDIVTRLFQIGAGFPKGNILITAPLSKHMDEQPQAQLGFAEQQKKYGMERLREMVETSGDVDRVITDVFAEYPNHEFNDDSFLSKPDAAYEWMHFHDTCSSRIFKSQEWELGPYLSQPVLACHHLFASPIRRANMGYDRKWGDHEDEAPPLPFSGPRADFTAREAEKENRAMLQAIQAQLPPTLMRAFRSAEDVSTEFLPYLMRLVSPEVKPVVVGGSGDIKGTASVRKDTEKTMVKRAADVLAEVGIELQRGKIESESMFSRGPQWVYRMEPDLDILATFETSAAVLHGTQAPTRYAVRQVLDQELQKNKILRDTSARQARFKAGNPHSTDDYIFSDKENAKATKETALPAIPVKKDFFGRVIKVDVRPLQETDGNSAGKRRAADEPLGKGETKVWVTYHEGMNNAVRKPITLHELLKGL